MNFFSRGKLLISGEYLVLKGAKALAVPLKKQQQLSVKEAPGKGRLKWISQEEGNEWFYLNTGTLLFDTLNTSDTDTARHLVRILSAARKLNPGFLTGDKDFEVRTDMDFKREWGFGSSSTLISNIAWWADIDPFDLHRRVSKGSGYDVVAARKQSPFYFSLENKLPVSEKAHFDPPFSDRVYFIYLGTKQDSASSIAPFLENRKQYRPEKRMVTELGMHLAEATSISDFEYYVKEHNLILSSILKIPDLKETRFDDLKGEIKPLGAWGGDFAMMTWNNDPDELKMYLADKQIDIYFTFKELIKQ